MSKQIPDHVAEFLSRANPAVMATTTKDGRPVAVATWYRFEDDQRIMVNLDATRVRLAHLRRDPRFALEVISADDWYSHVALRLDVEEIVDDEGRRDIDALAMHYAGRPYWHPGDRVSVRARISGWSGWGDFGGN